MSARRRAEQGGDRWIPDEFGVEHAVVLITNRDGSDEQVFLREDSPDAPSRPVSLVTVVTLLAGLRSGLVSATSRHSCTGYNCWRVHGEIGPADALAQSCNSFFEDLASRLGSGALGAAFASLGLDAPPIPEDRAARVRLATRSDGWTLTPRAALRLARALASRPAPWPEPLDEALVPRVAEPGPLRGKAGSDDTSGWFVGYTVASDERLVVARVSQCRNSCSVHAVRVARWALERVRGGGSALRDGPASSTSPTTRADAGSTTPASVRRARRRR